jgi:hypothetical protein
MQGAAVAVAVLTLLEVLDRAVLVVVVQVQKAHIWLAQMAHLVLVAAVVVLAQEVRLAHHLV